MLCVSDLETVFEEVVDALDKTQASDRELVLAKLCLLLAEKVGNADLVRAAIAAATQVSVPGQL